MTTRHARPLSKAAARTTAAALLLGAAAAMAAPIVYDFDTTIVSANPTGNPLQSNTVRGTITTDGTLGVLAAGNILSWNLDLIDNLDGSNNYTLTTANSALVVFTGTALSATATDLLFDFNSVGEVGIQANSPGHFSGWRYFCFSTGVFACLRGETIAPANVFTDGAVLTGAAAPVGVVPLAPPSSPDPGTVPEPATLALVGLAGLACARTRRTQRL